MAKIYIKAINEWYETTKEEHDNYYRDINAYRRTQQNHGNCACPRQKYFYCDMDCCTCKYRISADASFERVCISVWLKRNYPALFSSYSIQEDSVGDYLSPESWRCSMVASAYLGLPLTLAGVGAALKLEQQKMTEGKTLIRYFCVPYDTIDGIPQFHLPTDAPDKWMVFKAYNKRDVETEMGIETKMCIAPGYADLVV